MKDFSYIVNDTKFSKMWDRPNMRNIKKLMNFYSDNFRPQKFSIYMIGKMNSNKPHDTWDVDLLIASNLNPSNEEIVSCMKFLTENAINQFSILVDTQYFDNMNLLPLLTSSNYDKLWQKKSRMALITLITTRFIRMESQQNCKI